MGMTMHRFTGWLAFSILAATCTAMPAHATTVIELTDFQLADMAEDIIHATVLGSHVERIQDSGLIVTAVTVQVHEWLKNQGDTPNICTFYTRGGAMDGLIQTVDGDPSFQDGQEIVAFLERVPRYQNKPMLLGLAQGAFLIARQPVSRIDARTGIAISRMKIARTIPARIPSELEQAPDLETFLGRIRALVKEDSSHE